MWGHTGLRGGQRGLLKEIPETSGIKLHTERLLCKNSPILPSEITAAAAIGAGRYSDKTTISCDALISLIAPVTLKQHKPVC